MAVIATVCARGGSKGVPGKNSRHLLGKPLIAYTIEQAIAAPGIDAVYVSTDSPDLARIAETFGAIVPGLRPAELATDTAPKVPVIRHLVERVEELGVIVNKVVDLDVTAPLRAVADIEAALSMLDDDTDVIISGYSAEKNPYFNMVEIRPDGTAELAKQPLIDVTDRQSAPPVYSMNGSVYCWHRHTLHLGLWAGRARLYVMPHERSIDIDSPVDWDLVELSMERRHKAESVTNP